MPIPSTVCSHRTKLEASAAPKTYQNTRRAVRLRVCACGGGRACELRRERERHPPAAARAPTPPACPRRSPPAHCCAAGAPRRPPTVGGTRGSPPARSPAAPEVQRAALAGHEEEEAGHQHQSGVHCGERAARCWRAARGAGRSTRCCCCLPTAPDLLQPPSAAAAPAGSGGAGWEGQGGRCRRSGVSCGGAATKASAGARLLGPFAPHSTRPTPTHLLHTAMDPQPPAAGEATLEPRQGEAFVGRGEGDIVDGEVLADLEGEAEGAGGGAGSMHVESRHV